MLNTIFATKIGMSQAWSTLGKRLPITKLFVDDNCVLSVKQTQNQGLQAELAYGKKKLKNVSKPIRSQISKSGFSSGFKQIKGIEVNENIKQGGTITIDQVLSVGDVVAIQGTSKGRGFAGGVKRYSFHGGSRTHGQSDRQRAIGSIGSGTSPGRIWKGKRMPGRFGVETKTVLGLVVVNIDMDKKEIWVNGPVPGHKNSIVKIQKTGEKKDLQLNNNLFGESKKEEVKEAVSETQPEAVAETQTQPEAVEQVQEDQTNQEINEEKTA